MTKIEREERDRTRLAEMKAHEDELRAGGIDYVAGIDEVGRGPLAGPVYAACVVLPADTEILGIYDSKKLSAKKREELSGLILDTADAYGIGIADNNEIDEINILEATKNAMRRAVQSCSEMLRAKHGADASIGILLVDALDLDAGVPCEPIIKGDQKSLSIAAASIVAKVARDRVMTEMDEVYPGYDFAGNKGYGTARHYEGLRALGYTPIHRRSFLKKFEEERRSAGGMIPEKENKVAKKVYAVRKGKTTGIFTNWDDCKKQVDGFPGAEYKSFADPQDAMRYLGLEGGGTSAEEQFPEGVRAYVDGSYDAVNGRYSCGVVMIRTHADGSVRTRELSQVFEDPEAAKQRNIAGELMGAKLAIDFCLRNGIGAVTILHDYEGIGKWADGQWKARNPMTQGYADYVRRARERMDIAFEKVTAHAGNKYNELADKLAKAALEQAAL